MMTDKGEEIDALVRQVREETLRQAAAVVAGVGENTGFHVSWPFWTTGFAISVKNPVARFSAKASAAILALSDHHIGGAA